MKGPLAGVPVEDMDRVEAWNDSFLSDPDIKMFVRGLYAGGIHTTQDGICSAVFTMLSERRQWEAVATDPYRAAAVFEETLRRDAPHRGLTRFVTRDTEVAGTPLPAGSLVLLLYGSANRDESVFPAPDEGAGRPGRHRERAAVVDGDVAGDGGPQPLATSRSQLLGVAVDDDPGVDFQSDVHSGAWPSSRRLLRGDLPQVDLRVFGRFTGVEPGEQQQVGGQALDPLDVGECLGRERLRRGDLQAGPERQRPSDDPRRDDTPSPAVVILSCEWSE